MFAAAVLVPPRVSSLSLVHHSVRGYRSSRVLQQQSVLEVYDHVCTRVLMHIVVRRSASFLGMVGVSWSVLGRAITVRFQNEGLVDAIVPGPVITSMEHVF